MSAITDQCYVEQGISVWDMDDGYSFYAGRDFSSAFEFALEEWCGPGGPDDPMDRDNYNEAADESPCDLDALKVNLADEGQEPNIVTARERIRALLAEGATFPCFLCGTDS